MISNGSIGVAGAGSIGCFVGGMCAAAGRRTAFLGRPRVIGEIQAHGLRLTSPEGLDRKVGSHELILSQAPEILRDAAVVLVTVKSKDTAEMADTIARHAPADAIIVSLQNGVGNVAVLRERLPGRRVLAGMVPYYVIAAGQGQYRRAMRGDILLEQDDNRTAEQLSVPGLVVRPHPDITGVQWFKLLINLNNAINALADLPVSRQFARRAWRMLLADQMLEALAVLQAKGIKPVAWTPVPASWTPHVLRLPDAVFALMGGAIKTDPEARSSMWDDLKLRRPTEIDHLQGLIMDMADECGLKVPLTRRIHALVKSAEAEAKGSAGLTPEQIRPWTG